VALADYVDKERIEAGTVYPILEDLREVSAVVSLHSDFCEPNFGKRTVLLHQICSSSR